LLQTTEKQKQNSSTKIVAIYVAWSLPIFLPWYSLQRMS